MLKIKEWFYFLFRPKWEKKLYKLLKKASGDNLLSLNTILYDYCLPEEMDGKIYKIGVDAMFIGWLGVFNTALTVHKSYALQAQDVAIGLEEMSDGSATEIASHTMLHSNPTMKFYLRQMARYVASENVSENSRAYLNDLLSREYLGLYDCWYHRQKAAQKLLLTILSHGFTPRNMYSADFAGADSDLVQYLKLCLRRSVGVKASQVATKLPLFNWATMSAYYCSVVL